MSVIPSGAVNSILQSGLAQKEAAREVDTIQTAAAEAARRSRSGPDAFVEIEATDGDTQVHADSGGGGGQGRHDATPDEEFAPGENVEIAATDESGQPRLDISA